jgi:5,10-methylenetetrahydrofolate reductase
MFLDKIKSRKTGILIYGITPPKLTTPEEKIPEIAERTLSRLLPLNIDALIVYDVQDESARTSEERPFPFSSALDPFQFASQHLQALKVPKIIYRPAGKFTKEELGEWLEKMHQHGSYPVFVGVPSPDFQVKTSLNEAYGLWRKHEASSVIGAIMIPERHALLKDEDQRILSKVGSGVSFFVSQCVFNFDYTKNMIDALLATCATTNQPVPTLIFTLTACGSAKTLQFMDWLGIHVPEELKQELLASENILTKSIEVCLEIAAQIIAYCAAQQVPFGFNIESVAIKKEEIEASIHLVNQIEEMLKERNLRG